MDTQVKMILWNRCLYVIWGSVLRELKEHAGATTVSEDSWFYLYYLVFESLVVFWKDRMATFFHRLHEALQLLAEFFMADGRGLLGPKLYTEQYHEIEIFFSLNKVIVV